MRLKIFYKNKGKFGFSNCPKNSKIDDETNKIVIDKMKHDAKVFPIVEFVRLKPKMYLHIIEHDHGERSQKELKKT